MSDIKKILKKNTKNTNTYNGHTLKQHSKEVCYMNDK